MKKGGTETVGGDPKNGSNGRRFGHANTAYEKIKMKYERSGGRNTKKKRKRHAGRG